MKRKVNTVERKTMEREKKEAREKWREGDGVQRWTGPITNRSDTTIDTMFF